MSGNSRWLALGAMTLFTGCSLAAPANDFQSYGPFSVRSNGEGQLSTGLYTIVVNTAGVLEVGYLAPRSHCSSLRMHFLVDGVQKAVSDEVKPGQATGYLDLGPVEPGQHLVGLQAEGIQGGCNNGYVVAWGGSAMVWTTKFPPGRQAPIESIQAGCDGGLVGRYSGVRVHADGLVEQYSGPSYPPRAPELSHVPVERVQALFTRASALDLDSPQPSPIPDKIECRITIRAGAQDHVLSTDSGLPSVKEIFDATMELAKGEPSQTK